MRGATAGEPVTFERGETIWTESSYKYDRPRLDGVAGAAGFSVTRLWTDARERFWVAFLTPSPTPRDDGATWKGSVNGIAGKNVEDS